MDLKHESEPEESIPRNQFRQAYVASDGMFKKSVGARKEPSRNRVFVPARQATKAGRIDSLKSIPGLLKFKNSGFEPHSFVVPARQAEYTGGIDSLD